MGFPPDPPSLATGERPSASGYDPEHARRPANHEPPALDPLTHSLVGASLNRTRLGRSTRFASVALIGGANLPDLDVLSFAGGSDFALGFRRGWTHGPLGLLLLPPLVAALLMAYARFRPARAPGSPDVRPARVLALLYVASLTHPLLDALNTYGIRWLMPFDDRWFYGDAVFIVDPWLWLIWGAAAFVGVRRTRFPWGWLTLAVLASAVIVGAGDRLPLAARISWFAALVAIVWIHRRARPATGRPALVGLAVGTFYALLLLAISTYGATWIRRELPAYGVAPTSMMVGPRPGNPFEWSVVVETEDDYRHGSLAWRPRPSLELSPDAIAKARPSPIVDAALASPTVRGAVSWMRFPFVEVERTGDGYTVYILDARYVRARTRGFGAAVVELDSSLEPRRR
jgi:inner membrane protein